MHAPIELPDLAAPEHEAARQEERQASPRHRSRIVKHILRVVLQRPSRNKRAQNDGCKSAKQRASLKDGSIEPVIHLRG